MASVSCGVVAPLTAGSDRIVRPACVRVCARVRVGRYACPNIKDKEREVAPIVIACEKGFLAIIRYYVEQANVSYDFTEYTTRGTSPLQMARDNGHGKSARYLEHLVGQESPASDLLGVAAELLTGVASPSSSTRKRRASVGQRTRPEKER